MAEAVAVVSVAASIIQLVDFSSRAFRRLEEFNSKLDNVPKSFHHIKVQLPLLLATLKQIEQAIASGVIKHETEIALLPVVNGCKVQIDALDTIIDKVSPTVNDSWAKRSRKAFASLKQESSADKICSTLKGYVQTLAFYQAAASSAIDPLNSKPYIPWSRARRS